jgi:hypothetical protein
MEDIQLPRHVIDRLENRWASRLQQDARAWSSDKAKPFKSGHVRFDALGLFPLPSSALGVLRTSLSSHRVGQFGATECHSDRTRRQ